MATGNELTVVVPVEEYAIMNGPSAQIVLENLAGDQISAGDLPRIKVPTAGAKNWELPDGSTVQSFEGIIIYNALQKARWEGSTPTPGTPPVCFGRVDVQTGVWIGTGVPGGDCTQCPYNQFESEIKDGQPGRGKACKDKRICLVFTPTSIMPSVFYVPATSLSNMKRYLINLDRRYQNVVTRFGLEADRSASGIAYSKATFAKAGNVSAETAGQLASMIRAMTPLFQQIIVSTTPSDAE